MRKPLASRCPPTLWLEKVLTNILIQRPSLADEWQLGNTTPGANTHEKAD